MSFRSSIILLARTLGIIPRRTPSPAEAEALAAAAVLVRVARVDGDLSAREGARLEAALETRFGIARPRARSLLATARRIEDETGDLSTLIDSVGRDPGARRRLVAMAYSIASADGAMHEFEEDIVWRLGRQLGFDDGEIAAIRETQALQTL